MTSASPASLPRDVVVLVSGSGTNLQALIDAASDPAYGVRIVAVGADRSGIEGIARAERAGIPTFVCRVEDFHSCTPRLAIPLSPCSADSCVDNAQLIVNRNA